jgi:pantoate--beta-alanine ligase
MTEAFHKATLLTSRIVSIRESGKSVGLVPTMGALHEGHISLVKTSKQQNEYTVVSIFVNPTQFNNRQDLDRYPRMPGKDMEMLAEAGCDIVFMPDEREIYPEPDNRQFNFDGLDTTMEGKFRPGHFNGVAQVVTRLFDIVQPHRAYFGLKDFQQLAIIQKVVKDLHYQVEIVPCPIVRETDGLAMSSRNMLLSYEGRKKAVILSHVLSRAKEMKDSSTPDEVIKFVIHEIQKKPEIKLEYFEIIKSSNLTPAVTWDTGAEVIGCIAAWVDKIRLIDNINFSL